jgi:glycerol kinase
LEIWANVVACIYAVAEALKKIRIDLNLRLTCIGITNQRETTVAFNATTGKPYYNAIVWDDTRTNSIASQIASGNVDRLRDQTGLPLSSYFAGTKVKWLLDNCKELQADLKNKPDDVRFGTIDTWLLYQLTGHRSSSAGAANVGGFFITDVSNASRWLFCDIAKVKWDQGLVDTVCSPHSLPLSTLPEIRKSSEVYAICDKSNGCDVLDGVAVSAILGDQQAALFGQCAFEQGEAKNTYGTGMFLMMNTGTKRVPSTHGLLTTIGYQIGDDKVHYALEGSVSHSGSTIQWLRDQLGVIKNAAESETFARTTSHNDGLYFVPAFAGLFAPHWRSDARACIVGMTATHRKGHICRAALEAAAYQARELFDAMYADSHVILKALKVDGGGTNNKLLMQFQSDIINVPVVKPKVMETTSMGAAFAAGLAVGVWKNVDEIRCLCSIAETYKSTMAEAEREKNWAGWQKAVTKSLNWEEIDDEDNFEDAQQAVEKLEEVEARVAREASRDLSTEKTAAPEPAQGFSTVSVVLVTICGIAAGFLLGRHRK